jgi:hypothetical protein
MEFRIQEIENKLESHDRAINRIADQLTSINDLISQIRYFISGGVCVFVIDKIGFFEALGMVT